MRMVQLLIDAVPDAGPSSSGRPPSCLSPARHSLRSGV